MNPMEFILGIAVIVIILLILGFGVDVIMIGFVGLLCLMSASSSVVLLYFGVRLMFSKRCEGEFTRIGRQGKRRYDAAFYSTDEGELPNVFPAEVVMKERFYRPDKKLRMRIDRGKKYVYDSNARLTIILGTPLCSLLTAGIWYIALLLYGAHP